MAKDMFFKIGDLKGESQDKKHKDEIDVLSWSWGVSNSGSAHTGSGAGSGKAEVKDLSFTKLMDKASPTLFLSCLSGKHFPEATLVIRKAGEKPVEYCKIKLSQVLISAVDTGGSSNGDRLTEVVHLNFGQVSLDYTPQDDKGQAGTAIPMSWDVSANAQP
jgi:type VI secretion system secreted protein Hcp